MGVAMLRGRPRDLDGLRSEWKWLRSQSDAAVAGLDATGTWFGFLLEPRSEPDVSLLGGGEFAVHATQDVQVVLDGADAFGAQFVQVMVGHVEDRAGWEMADAQAVPRFAALRPDFRGAWRIWQGDRLTVVDAYESETRARTGEALGYPAEDEALFAAWFAHLRDVEWHDLLAPW